METDAYFLKRIKRSFIVKAQCNIFGYRKTVVIISYTYLIKRRIKKLDLLVYKFYIYPGVVGLAFTTFL
jgi:hypothetical protein